MEHTLQVELQLANVVADSDEDADVTVATREWILEAVLVVNLKRSYLTKQWRVPRVRRECAWRRGKRTNQIPSVSISFPDQHWRRTKGWKPV